MKKERHRYSRGKKKKKKKEKGKPMTEGWGKATALSEGEEERREKEKVSPSSPGKSLIELEEKLHWGGGKALLKRRNKAGKKLLSRERRELHDVPIFIGVLIPKEF
jgi:hypothetical protein